MLTYIAARYAKLLQGNQLDTFDKVWNYKADWFEEPNERRGGWSGVGRITLKAEDGSEIGAYLKRQDNHFRLSLLHPVKGVPTFEREFEMLQHLEQHGVPAPEVMLFGRNPAGDLKTTLLTKELTGYVSLEELTERLFAEGRPALAAQRAVVGAVAALVKQLHAAKVQHRSFYPKHLFVNMADANAPKVAVIDLEKSRINCLPLLRTLVDLGALNRHAKHWSKSRRMYFFLHYLGTPKLTPYTKWLCRRILKRSSRVKRSK